MEWLSKIRAYRNDSDAALIDATLAMLREHYVRFQQFTMLPNADLAETAATLRGWEGAANRQYLDTLAQLLPESGTFDKRSRRPALDPFNASLNYGYGILYRWVEKALWESGLNPYIGCLHSNERRQKSLLFDFIEPFRPWVDRTVFTLFSRKELGAQHIQDINGGVRLNKAGKQLVASTLRHRFHQSLRMYHGKRWNLRQWISLEARQYAAMLRKHLSQGKTPVWPDPVADEQEHEPGASCDICVEDL
jgi:CRISP-associated protein Cas1